MLVFLRDQLYDLLSSSSLSMTSLMTSIVNYAFLAHQTVVWMGYYYTVAAAEDF